MHRQVGDLEIVRGVAVSGLLVRHLVMPRGAASSKAILRFLASVSPETYVNVMGQYRPGLAGCGWLGGWSNRRFEVNIVKWVLIVLGGLVVSGGLFLSISLFVVSRQQPKTEEVDLGVENGGLRPCPETPNCVSTQADPADETHYAEPIAYEGSAEKVLERLTDWIRQQPRAEVARAEERYLRAVFTSRVFGFHDDVELYLPQGESVVHLRSASRVGQGDMGVNRDRYRAIRAVVRSATEGS